MDCLIASVEANKSKARAVSAIIPFPRLLQELVGNGDSLTKIEEAKPAQKQEKGSEETTLALPGNLAFWYSTLDEHSLTPAAIAVLTHLARRCGNSDGEGYPSIRTIAQIRGLTPRTVIRAIHELEQAGIITVERNANEANRYTIRSPKEWQEWRATHGGDTRKTGGDTRAPRSNVLKEYNKAKKPFASATEKKLKPKRSTPNENGLIATPDNIAAITLADRYPRLDVLALLPAARRACMEKYPFGGPMRVAFFKELLDRAQSDLPTPGLVEGQQIRQEVRAEAAPHREEAKTQEPSPEEKRERFIADLAQRFPPQINVPAIAIQYLEECEEKGIAWDEKRFERRVGEAVATFWKECRHSGA
ncbi:MAG: helix-turn-helix domain-containing protein [Verrucomicrobia bacterium]|nr:helix-turn-helix domain-containing protein [Verrucomicrobiota bacterium]